MRNKKINILILIILITILIPIKSIAYKSNDEKFEKISVNDGLSNEYVTDIFQDSKGYIWIGTKDGLNRFDGSNIKIYNYSDGDRKDLSSTYINDIAEDINGNIWIATDSGLDFLVVDSDEVVRMKDRQEDKYNLGGLNITSVLQSKYDENIMWVGTENGLMKFDLSQNTTQAFYHNENDSNSLTNSYITCLKEDSDNNLWVGTKYGVNVLDKNSKFYVNEHQEARIEISNIEEDKQGKIWISVKEGIYVSNIGKEDILYRINDKNIKKVDFSGKIVEDVYEIQNDNIRLYNNFVYSDSEGHIWISSSNGVLKLSRNGDFNTLLQKDIDDKYSISSNRITCFYEDFNGTMWIGTNKGVNILSQNSQFRYMGDKVDEDIVSIIEHDNQIWVATKFNGMYVYNKDLELIKNLHRTKEFDFNDRYINRLFKVDDEDLLIVTNREVISYNTKTLNYEKIEWGDDYSTELSYIYSDEENIWVCTTDNFYSYNIKDGKRIYYNDNFNKENINISQIKYILQDKNDENILWLGGINTGLIKYHKAKGIMNIYKVESDTESSIVSNYINCMEFDKDGCLWIGTNRGISKFEVESNQFTSYTTSDGLTNNFINSIVIDDSNYIWISTNQGLNKLDEAEENIINYTKMDGLYGQQFNLNSSLKLENGYMLFGSTDGFIFFKSDDITDYKSYDKDVVIGDIFVDQNKVIYDGNKLILDHNYKNLSISYFLPIYENLNTITYEYMLEGIDSDWIYVDSSNNLNFKSLDSGEYTLKIRARGIHGELTGETNVNIRVKSPIWKTPIAYLIYILIGFGILYYVFNYLKILQRLVDQKTESLNNQMEENKRLSQEIIEQEQFKNNYFVNLSHELRTPINVIMSTLGVINIFKENKKLTADKLDEYIKIISKNCDNLLRVTNDIIDSSKIETGKYKINKNNYDIVYVVEEAALNMSKFIEEKGISLVIDPDMEEKIISFDKIEIERCIVNLLGNAVKFTKEGGKITLYIKEVENYIEIIVKDTGIGISKEDQEFIFKRFSQGKNSSTTKVTSSGIGLTLVKYIVELHDGYIKLDSEVNKGSKFTIGIPNRIENKESLQEI